MMNKKYNKYGNIKVVIDGIEFQSIREGARYRMLKMLLYAGKISDLNLQVPFELAPSVVIEGRKRPPLRYNADFVYTENGRIIVCDAKGAITDVYRIKRHLMKAVYVIDILEV